MDYVLILILKTELGYLDEHKPGKRFTYLFNRSFSTPRPLSRHILLKNMKSFLK